MFIHAFILAFGAFTASPKIYYKIFPIFLQKKSTYVIMNCAERKQVINFR